jgi:hypothetical protein
MESVMPQADNITEDTSVSTDPTANEETVDTSTNEEAQDTDVELEDMDISFEDEEDTDETEDSEDETQDTEPAESEEESEEDEQQEDVADEEPVEEDTTPTEDTKKHNAEMAAKRIAEKQAREKAKEEQQQRYLEDAEDARDLAVRQLQIDAYNNKVERNRNKLDSGIEKAVASIDLFRDGSPEVKEELARRLEDFEAKHVQYDSNGDPIQVNGDVYEYLQNEADSIRRILNTGARNQSKAKTKAKARTETLPTRAPKEPKVDPDIVEFEKAWEDLQ